MNDITIMLSLGPVIFMLAAGAWTAVPPRASQRRPVGIQAAAWMAAHGNHPEAIAVLDTFLVVAACLKSAQFPVHSWQNRIAVLKIFV